MDSKAIGITIIQVDPGVMEREQGGKTSSVLSVTLGSIKFRYDKLTGSPTSGTCP